MSAVSHRSARQLCESLADSPLFHKPHPPEASPGIFTRQKQRTKEEAEVLKSLFKLCMCVSLAKVNQNTKPRVSRGGRPQKAWIEGSVKNEGC